MKPDLTVAEHYMKKCLGLAKKGQDYAHPNPMVGAVLVKNDKVIGQGYHARYGTAHAEINALHQAVQSPAGSTLYVNLEPCCHHGKTAPCTTAIIRAGIRKVVVGTLDPNPLVHNKGVRTLRKAGIEVQVGILEEQCRTLNRVFYKWIQTGIPYVTLKVAQTLDGKISVLRTEEVQITGPESVRYVHRLRARHDGILVGRGTVESDDPELTVRGVRGRNPKRIILDSGLRLGLRYKVFQNESAADTVIAFSSRADIHKQRLLEKLGYRCVRVPREKAGYLSLKPLLRKLGNMGISSLLVEGGQYVFSSFLRQKQYDELQMLVAPKVFGDGISSFQCTDQIVNDRLKLHRTKKLGGDVLLEYRSCA